VKRHAREFGERLTSQRRDVEKGIDDAVRRAASRFRIPSREDIDALQKRLDAIAERVETLAKDREKPV
jgi:polyhydroxyalkanoate synthesis regulator phasin